MTLSADSADHARNMQDATFFSPAPSSNTAGSTNQADSKFQRSGPNPNSARSTAPWHSRLSSNLPSTARLWQITQKSTKSLAPYLACIAAGYLIRENMDENTAGGARSLISAAYETAKDFGMYKVGHETGKVQGAVTANSTVELIRDVGAWGRDLLAE